MAELFQPTFRYGGISNPNLTAGAELIMKGLGAPGKLSAQMQADERQAIADAQNKQIFDMKIAEANRLEQERLGKEKLAGELLKLPTQKATTQVVSPAVTAQDVEAVRQGLLDDKYSQAGKTYAEEFAKLTAPKAIEESPKLPPLLYPKDQQSGLTFKGQPVDLSKIFEGNLVTALDDMVKEEMYGKGVVPEASQKLTPEALNAAHIEALKRSGLSEDMTGKEFKVDSSKLPKESKEVTKQVMKKLSDAELKQGKLDLVRELAQSGAIPSTLALETANKINAPKSEKAKMDELKYLLDLRKEDRQDKELKAKIAAGHFGKNSSGKGFSFGEQLYTLAGPEGLDAAKNYLKNNKQQLESMSTGDKKELLAYLTAKYGHEDDWFTWTGWDDLK